MMPIGILGAGSAEGGIGVAGGAGASGGIGILGPAAGLATLDNYIEDDFGDNALTGRTGQTRDAFLEPSTDHAGRVLAGIYRPDWTTESGSPSVSGGKLQLPDGSGPRQVVSTPSIMEIGSWAFDFTVSSGGTGGSFGLSIGEEFDLQDQRLHASYFTDIRNGGNFDLYQMTTGGAFGTSLISGTWGGDTNQHSTEFTRDPFGGFELFIDTVSQGTATDTTYSDFILCAIGNAMDTSCTIDNLVIS